MKANRNNIFLALLTLVMVVVWIGFEIFRTYKTSTIEPDVSVAITPLDPSVDEKVLTDIQSRFKDITVNEN